MFGRLDDDSRFIANTPADDALLREMTEKDFLGATGKVAHGDGVNIFTPD